MINLVNISSVRILLACLILVIFVVFCSGCSYSCKFSPDYEKISDSASKNIENLAETNLKSGKVVCNF